jgi:hypothetical protein
VKRTALFGLLVACALAGCARQRATTQPSVSSTADPPGLAIGVVSESDRTTAIRRGVEFLVKSQQPEGNWGTGLETRGLEIYSMVPGSHDAFRVATTALCVMALREAIEAGVEVPGMKEAHAKGVEYLVTAGKAHRDSGPLLYNIWAHTYALEALAVEMRSNSDPRVRDIANWNLDRMIRYATYMGGWNYYDFEAQTQQPSLAPTSFGTAAGLVALWQARKSGMDVPQKLVDSALKRLAECRLPNGVFLYGNDGKYYPRMGANRDRGAVGRTQPSNFGLWLWKSPAGGELEAKRGLDLFFEHHIYLDMGRKRPYPHEAWYQTSGYYYYYDHYYAAHLIRMLPPADQQVYLPKLAWHVYSHQEPDGSWWDYAMWDYHKPYGTAFAVMTLLRC